MTERMLAREALERKENREKWEFLRLEVRRLVGGLEELGALAAALLAGDEDFAAFEGGGRGSLLEGFAEGLSARLSALDAAREAPTCGECGSRMRRRGSRRLSPVSLFGRPDSTGVPVRRDPRGRREMRRLHGGQPPQDELPQVPCHGAAGRLRHGRKRPRHFGRRTVEVQRNALERRRRQRHHGLEMLHTQQTLRPLLASQKEAGGLSACTKTAYTPVATCT